MRQKLVLNQGGEVHNLSPTEFRQCHILPECGSCPYLDMPYARQLQQKTQNLADIFSDYPELSGVKVTDCMGSPLRLAYRHSVKLVFSERSIDGKRWIKIGLFQPQSHTVIDIERCPIQSDLVNNLVAFLRSAVKKFKLSVYSEKARSGFLRYLVIRTDRKSTQAIVTFVTYKPQSLNEETFLKQLSRDMSQQFSAVCGVIQHINTSQGNEMFRYPGNDAQDVALSDKLLSGRDFLEEEFLPLKLRFPAGAFAQINPFVAERMYNRIVEIADIRVSDVALDLYCGVGAIGLRLALQANYVYGFEESAVSVKAAHENALLNGIQNFSVTLGRTEDTLPESLQTQVFKSLPQLVTINPSRKGCAPGVVKALLEISPRTIVYMSCFPETLARDVSVFVKNGYVLRLIEPHDMFPGTPHIETLALLTKP